MEGYVATVSYLFAVGTVLLLLLLLLMILTRLATKTWLPLSVDGWVRRNALFGVAFFAVFGVLVSFWYSEVVGFVPCVLCWLARTMIFPLAVIAPIAVYRKDSSAWVYLFAPAVVGMLITGYHHLYQMGFTPGTLCEALQGGGGCDKLYVFEFGFVTMPLMAFATFAVIALLAWLSRKA